MDLSEVKWDWTGPTQDQINKCNTIRDDLQFAAEILVKYNKIQGFFDIGELDTRMGPLWRDSDCKMSAANRDALGLLTRIQKIVLSIDGCRDDLKKIAKAKCLARNLSSYNEWYDLYGDGKPKNGNNGSDANKANQLEKEIDELEEEIDKGPRVIYRGGRRGRR